MVSVRTSIFGRPRRLPSDRRADPLYTLIYEVGMTRSDGLAVRRPG